MAPDQILIAHQIALRLRELRLELDQRRLRGLQLRLRLGQGGPLGRVLEPRHDLALLYVVALLDQHLGERAGDLGRNRRLAARGDVAGRLQDRRAGATLGGRLGAGDLHLDRRSAAQQPHRGEDCRQHHEQRSAAQPPGARDAATLRGRTVDVQLLQQCVLVVSGSHRSTPRIKARNDITSGGGLLHGANIQAGHGTEPVSAATPRR